MNGCCTFSLFLFMSLPNYVLQNLFIAPGYYWTQTNGSLFFLFTGNLDPYYSSATLFWYLLEPMPLQILLIRHVISSIKAFSIPRKKLPTSSNLNVLGTYFWKCIPVLQVMTSHFISWWSSILHSKLLDWKCPEANVCLTCEFDSYVMSKFIFSLHTIFSIHSLYN